MSKDLFLATIGLLVTSFLLSGCSQEWSKVIERGSIGVHEFTEEVEFTVKHGLVIAPVTIRGKTYQFLFDTGAMLSLSEELQAELKFKKVSEGQINDSDNNKATVAYVSVDSLFIGDVPFLKQTAFVADFKANQIIKCLEIDGIIGSNLMRHCNWKIDVQNKKMTFNSSINSEVPAGAISIPFRKDRQYNLLVNLPFGKSVIKNLKIDYGSNGGITLPKKVWNILKERQILEHIYAVRGVKNSGLIGKPIKLNGEIAFSDSLKMGISKPKYVNLKTGTSGLVGTKILSRYVTTIDWKRKKLYLEPVANWKGKDKTFGMKIGYSATLGFYVQSVVENSPASEQGVKPNMQVKSIDGRNTSEGFSYCDYINYVKTQKELMTLELEGTDGAFKVVLERRKL